MKNKCLIVFICSMVIIGNSFSQKIKSNKKYYKVPKSEYSIYENEILVPRHYIEDIEVYSDYDDVYLEEISVDYEPNSLPNQIESEDYLITITDIGKIPIEENDEKYQLNTFLRSRFKHYYNESDKKHVTMNDTSIVIHLSNGDTKSYYAFNYLEEMSNMKALLMGYNPKEKAHFYEGYLPQYEAFLISYIDDLDDYALSTDAYYGSVNYILVSKKDGSEIRWTSDVYNDNRASYPILSPNREKIFYINSRSLSLYSVQNKKFIEEIRVNFFDHEYQSLDDSIIEIKWKDENSVVIVLQSYDYEENEYVYLQKLIRFQKR